MRFTSRNTLLAALVVGQLVCLVGGGLWFGRWLDHSLRALCSRQVLQDNALIATQFANLIEKMNLNQVAFGSEDWQRLQQAVEEIQLPNEGFICITENPSGTLLCHPALRSMPEMAQMTPGQVALDTGAVRQPIVQLMSQEGSARGVAEMPDGIHLVAARRIPKLDVNVMVHQRLAGVRASIGRVVGPVYGIAFVVAAAVMAVTALVNLVFILRYENRLAVANQHLEDAVQQRTRSLIKTRNATVFGLAKLAESRDTDTGEHLERIRDYVVLLAQALARNNREITPAFVEDLALASSLHDIGKVGISDEVLLKPGRLTAEERRIIQCHAQIGGDCLAAIERRLGDDDFLDMARTIAYSHHERWDGLGYPHGLKETEIPLAARIVAVADVYDALTSKRPYKDAMSHDEAYDLIVAGTGTQFDPEVVAAFIVQEREFATRRESVRRPGCTPVQFSEAAELVPASMPC